MILNVERVLNHVLITNKMSVFFFRGAKISKGKNNNNPIQQPLVQENFGNFISEILYYFECKDFKIIF